MIEGLDHINVRTGQLDTMIGWYERVLGLTAGWRPGFPFAGAWLYAGERPVVHLVDAGARPGADASDLRIEHGAFRASGYREFVARLEAAGEPHDIARVPEMPLLQVNLRDPDGNHLHIDFDAAEAG